MICIIGTHISSQVPNLQKYLKYTEPEIADATVPAIHNKTMWVAGQKKNRIPTNSVFTLSVKCGIAGRIKEERRVTFEPNRNLEHMGLILTFTLSKFHKGVCGIQVVNITDEDLFLSTDTQLGTISDASVDFSSQFNVVDCQKVHTYKLPSTEKRMNECHTCLSKFTRNER